MGDFCASKSGLPVSGTRLRSKKPKSFIDPGQLVLFKEDNESKNQLSGEVPGDLLAVSEGRAAKAIARAFQSLWGDADVGPWIAESHEVQTVLDAIKRVAIRGNDVNK